MWSRTLAAFALWLAAGEALLACPICFQMDDEPTKAGVRAAVAVLGLVTVAVLAGFAVFARRIARHESTNGR